MGVRFSSPVQTGPGAHPTPVHGVPGLFPGVKRLRHVFSHPIPPSTEVKERVELHLYPFPRPSWLVLHLLFFTFSTDQTGFCTQLVSYKTIIVGYSPRVKWMGSKGDHSS